MCKQRSDGRQSQLPTAFQRCSFPKDHSSLEKQPSTRCIQRNQCDEELEEEGGD